MESHRNKIRKKHTEKNVKDKICSVADPGCLSRIPDPTFFHPGSRIQIVSIPDPGSASKDLSILTQKSGF
jgi:hypothetical protein